MKDQVVDCSNQISVGFLERYEAAKKKYQQELAQYKKDLGAYQKWCVAEKIRKMEAELAQLKKGDAS